MSEFSPQTAPMPPPTHTPPPSRQVDINWLKRPVIWGQSIPWLALYAAMLIGAAMYFFAPEPKSNVNRLAFGSQDLQPATESKPSTFATVNPDNTFAPVASGPDLSQMQDQVAAMIASVRTYSDVNRQAIEQLAQKVNAMADVQALLKQQMSELQAQKALLSARSIVSPSTSANRVARSKPAKADHPPASSPLAGMQVRGVQNGMAWVFWQDKTWAVQVGDPLGPVTIIGIDAQARQVRTSAGTLQ